MNLKKLQKAHTTFGRLMGGRRYQDIKGAGDRIPTALKTGRNGTPQRSNEHEIFRRARAHARK